MRVFMKVHLPPIWVFGVLMTFKLGTNVILMRYVTAITQYALSKGFIFVFEFRIRRTIKMDANLVGLRKIECLSIKIKSKERHSSTPRTHRIFFYDC